MAPISLSLFRGASLKQSSTDSSVSAAADEETADTVLDELKRWEDKDLQEYSQYIAEDGLLNEFKMMWELRKSFPLHITIFKQTACHLSHEANVEQVFSRAGLLADPNLLPAHLSTLVMVAFNKNAFKPQIAVGVSRGAFAKFRPEKDAFIETSNLTQSLSHNQTPLQSFKSHLLE